MRFSLALALSISFVIGSQSRAAVREHNVGTLHSCLPAIKEIQRASQIRDSLGPDESKCRFMKSARWGWVDFRHFGASARMVERQGLFALTDGAIVFALVAGESHEQILDDPSQYSYEDLPSNFLGAAFQSMYARGFFAKKSYAAALVAFLRHLEMQDSTVLTETDRRMMDDVVMNRTYSPIGNSRSSWAPKSWVLLEINRLRLVALVAVSPTRPLREAIFNLPVVEDAARSLDQRSR